MVDMVIEFFKITSKVMYNSVVKVMLKLNGGFVAFFGVELIYGYVRSFIVIFGLKFDFEFFWFIWYILAKFIFFFVFFYCFIYGYFR